MFNILQWSLLAAFVLLSTSNQINDNSKKKIESALRATAPLKVSIRGNFIPANGVGFTKNLSCTLEFDEPPIIEKSNLDCVCIPVLSQTIHDALKVSTVDFPTCKTIAVTVVTGIYSTVSSNGSFGTTERSSPQIVQNSSSREPIPDDVYYIPVIAGNNIPEKLNLKAKAKPNVDKTYSTGVEKSPNQQVAAEIPPLLTTLRRRKCS